MLSTLDPTPEPDRRSAEPDKQTADSASAQTEDFATQIQPRHHIVGDASKLNTFGSTSGLFCRILERPNDTACLGSLAKLYFLQD